MVAELDRNTFFPNVTEVWGWGPVAPVVTGMQDPCVLMLCRPSCVTPVLQVMAAEGPLQLQTSHPYSGQAGGKRGMRQD